MHGVYPPGAKKVVAKLKGYIPQNGWSRGHIIHDFDIVSYGGVY